MTVRAANQRVFGILCARNEQDLLRANILHHLWIGCERVLVVDNASTDGSRRILKKLARTHSVDWRVCPKFG
jgi:glycosyltransferase involved in cell wall biosynthesis